MCEVKQSNIIGAGRGVFTTRDFKKGDLICYYNGICKSNKSILTEDEKCYAIGFNKLSIVGYKNPKSPEGIGQLINDCSNIYLDSFQNEDDDVCAGIQFVFNLYKRYIITNQLYNNVMIEESSDNTKARVIAIKDIKSKSELYFSYGIGYWHDRLLSDYRKRAYHKSIEPSIQSEMFAYYIYTIEVAKNLEHNHDNDKFLYDQYMRKLNNIDNEDVIYRYLDKPGIYDKVLRENSFYTESSISTLPKNIRNKIEKIKMNIKETD